MMQIITFANPRMAQAFVDYMATQHIVLTIEQREQTEVWLADEKLAARVQEELQRFLEDPNHPRYLEASWSTGQTNSGLRYQRFSFIDTIKKKSGPLTLFIIALCVLIYALMQLLGDEFIMYFLAWPADTHQYWQLWRWFSHALLHFSVLHITFNLLWWWYLGGPVEKRLGTGKLLTLTLVSALLSGWVQSHYSGIWFGGLSGVVYALMGYVWLRGEGDPRSGIYMQRGLMVFALLWLVAGYFDILGLSIANAAHVTGLVVGLIMALVDVIYARKRT